MEMDHGVDGYFHWRHVDLVHHYGPRDIPTGPAFNACEEVKQDHRENIQEQVGIRHEEENRKPGLSNCLGAPLGTPLSRAHCALALNLYGN